MQQEKQQTSSNYPPDDNENIVIYDESGFPIGEVPACPRENSRHSVEAIDESGFVTAVLSWEDPPKQSDPPPHEEKSSGPSKTLAVFLAVLGTIASWASKEGNTSPKTSLSQKQSLNPIIFLDNRKEK